MYKGKFDKSEMVCTGGANRPCQGDGGAPLVSHINNMILCYNFISSTDPISYSLYDI